MSRNAGGTYSLPVGNPVVGGTTIESTWANNTMSDIAAALTDSISRSGLGSALANLPMGGFRHTGVGDAQFRTSYASYGQIQDGAPSWCGTAGGTADALTLTPTIAIPAYVVGQEFVFKAASSNTGAATIAVSGLTAGAAQTNGAALSASQIVANRLYRAIVSQVSPPLFQLEEASLPTVASAVSNIPGSLTLTGVISPTTLVANTNDWAPTSFSTSLVIRATASAAIDLTGIAAGSEGRLLCVHNPGSFAITLKDESASSSAANRFALNGDYVLGPDQSVWLIYDNTSTRWRLVGQPLNAPVGGAVGLTAAAAANALTITIPAGTQLQFRDATVANGALTNVTLASAITLTLSNGSTLGTTASVPNRFWIVVFNDAGTYRVGAINCLLNATTTPDIFPLGGSQIASSTAEGGAGAADSAHTFYTGTAVTNKPYAIAGYLEYSSGLGTAGVYASNPTLVQPFTPGLPMPGSILQQVFRETTTSGSTANVIPADNTVPQTGEMATAGVDCAITPKSAANVIRVKQNATIARGSGTTAIGLFKDAGASAVRMRSTNDAGSATYPTCLSLDYQEQAASVTSRTYKLYYGGSTANIYINRHTGGDFYGGTYSTNQCVEELQA